MKQLCQWQSIVEISIILILGVDSVNQLQDILKISVDKKLLKVCNRSLFSSIDKRSLDPRKWN